jgi:Ni/Fe-hydrogenase 1 B-type cytochrome subunit
MSTPIGSTLASVENVFEPTFNEKHSVAIRIWHWTLFLTICASLLTVLLASTVFRTRNTMPLVQDELQSKGMTVSPDQARAVAHAYNDKLWELHKWAGFIVCGLLFARIIIEVAQPGDEKLGRKLKNALGLKTNNPGAEAERKHYIQVKTVYLVFYGLILLMALTGLVLAFEDVAALKGIHGAARQLHSFLQYLIYGFILMHLVGVIRADLGKNKGLVSGMINGKK